MNQSLSMSVIETTVSIASGALIAFMLTYFVLPLWGHQYSPGESLSITALYTVASWVRSFCVRRIFCK